MQSFSASHNPGDDEQRSENHFQAELDAELLKSNNLELQLEESKHFYEGQPQQMRDRIEYLKETQPHQGRVATACGEDESASKLEEASHMEMTQMVMDETTLHGESESNGLLLELQDKVSVLSKALTDMEQENVDLKEALAVMHHHRQATGHNGIPGEGDDLERNSELEVELESTQNELSWMKSRWKALDVLVLRSEHLLEIQGKKLEKSENALKKTRELYAYERSARLSIERINETTQIVMGKLHGKMEDRRYEIDQLQGLLTQYNVEAASVEWEALNEFQRIVAPKILNTSNNTYFPAGTRTLCCNITCKMDRANIKYAPAIHDFTAEDVVEEDDEGMEAVLMDSKGRPVQEKSRSNGRFMTQGEADEWALLEIIRRRDWDHLMDSCINNPHLAYVKFSSRSNMNKGNLILHEACKHNPPIHILDAIYDANESAVMIKGFGGYFPLHHACASGASEEVIRYLISKFPGAVCCASEQDHTFPLHLACKMGTSEDTLMLLLTHCPEAAVHQDDFGRLPLDYAKNLRSTGARDVAIKCLDACKWIEKSAALAREKIENEFVTRIRGYEESQAKQLKMIREVHEEEISELESALHSYEKQLTKQSKVLKRVETELGHKGEENEKQTKSLAKLQTKIGELSEVLQETRDANGVLSTEAGEREKELEIALGDIETLNQHSEWLESKVSSIRKIANTEAPLVKLSLHRRDENQWRRGLDATSERSLSQEFIEGPASRRSSTAIPKFKNRLEDEADTLSRSDTSIREDAE
ncbi:MAG: hypothetical protein SGILL_006979 [Bacillariaceae sp.]